MSLSAPEQTPAWLALRAHRAARRKIPLRRLFMENRRRFEEFSLQFDDLLLDFSKTALTAETVSLLEEIAATMSIGVRRDAMFGGEIINESERRAVCHPALRAEANSSFGGGDAATDIQTERRRMLSYAEQCRGGGNAVGGGDFTDILNIGIGGQRLAVEMAAAALRSYHGKLRLHFVSNMDGAAISDALATLDARHTLVIISSKTFSTTETLHNAERAKRWLAGQLGGDNIHMHLAATTASAAAAKAFGIRNIFIFPDCVGGRYSIWGAAGLPLALAVGKKHFTDFLRGAQELDVHFCTAAPRDNMPFMLGLLGIWHRNICGYRTRAILPYDWRLSLLPSYLQQLDMESNGKNVCYNGVPTKTATVPVVWGTAGTDAQHAYFQMLHQGTDIVPCEFVAVVAGGNDEGEEQRRLLTANCFAQSAALMHGDKTTASHLRFCGGRPSATLLFKRLTPHSLGRLLALYEHRTFVEGAIWGINSFDQWGVQLGKSVATKLHSQLSGKQSSLSEDSSTAGLIQHYRRLGGD